MANPRILVCDDEPHLREMVGEYLAERGFEIAEASNAEELENRLEEEAPDLVILDVNMPGKDGLTVLRELRTNHTMPVIMLTAAVDVVDRVVGLEMGADDYVGKPVDLRELEARVKAALRRQTMTSSGDMQTNSVTGTITCGTCMLDVDNGKLTRKDGTEVPLTVMEFNLLKVFVENRGRVLNRDQLLEKAHNRDWEPFDRSIDLRISRLRKKIEINPTKPEAIRTVRGLGYIFD